MSLIRRNADTRKFLLDHYEDDVCNIIDNVIENEDVDTEMVTHLQLFRMSVDIVKKRESYIPRQRKKKKKKSPVKATETVDLTLSVSKVAAKVAAAATVVKMDP